MEVFDRVMPGPNQLGKLREDVTVTREQMLKVHDGERSEQGLRENIRVGVQYIEAWLRGRGAVPLYNLMEDAATAEISRTQIWQWVQQAAKLSDGRVVTARAVQERARRGDGHAEADTRRAVRNRPLRRGDQALLGHEPVVGVRGVPHPAGLRRAGVGGASAGKHNVAQDFEESLSDALRSVRTRPLFVIHLPVRNTWDVGATPAGHRRTGMVAAACFAARAFRGEVLDGGTTGSRCVPTAR